MTDNDNIKNEHISAYTDIVDDISRIPNISCYLFNCFVLLLLLWLIIIKKLNETFNKNE